MRALELGFVMGLLGISALRTGIGLLEHPKLGLRLGVTSTVKDGMRCYCMLMV